MRLLRASLSICLLATGLVSFNAQAQVTGPSEDVPAVSHAPPGKDAVQRGVQAPGGMASARVVLHMNMSKDAVAEPVSLAPDLFFALSDTLQLGLLHNGPMGWQTRPGAGLCLTGEAHGCPKVYDNVGFDLMYGLAFGDFNFSLHSSLYLLRIRDPLAAMWTIGAAGKLHFSDAVALFFDPQFGIALTDRSGTNKDMLFLPLELQFQLSPPAQLKILSGLIGQLSKMGDTYQIPLGLGFVYNVSTGLDLGLRFSFDNLLGKTPPGVSRTDTRSLALLMNLRF